MQGRRRTLAEPVQRAANGWLVCLLAGLVFMAVAVVLDVERSGGGHASRPIPVANIGRLNAATKAAKSARPKAGRPALRDPLRSGARLRLARLHLDAAITTVTTVANVMNIPRDPRIVGWWNGGSAPGERRGTAVIVGHVNFAGSPGALAVLPDARLGDSVVVSGADLDVRYQVFAIRSYAKSAGIPATVFSRGGPAQLVLITCGGSFDSETGNYRDNIVLYARPV